MELELYFLCGYIVEEFKEDVYKLVGCKVCDVYGNTCDLSIDEYNEYQEALFKELEPYKTSTLLNLFMDSIYFSRLSNVAKINKELAKLEHHSSKDYFVSVDLADKLDSSSKIKAGATVHINESDKDIYFKGKILYRCSKVPVFDIVHTVEFKDYNRSLDVMFSAYYNKGSIEYKPEGVDVCDLKDEGNLDCYSIAKDRVSSFNFTYNKVITTIPSELVKNKLDFIGSDDKFVWLGDYYSLYGNDKQKNIIIPSDCSYLFNAFSFATGIESIVFSPKFKGLVWSEKRETSDCIYSFFPDLQEVYLSKTLGISGILQILCSFIRSSSKKTKERLMAGICDTTNLESAISILNYNFNNILNSKVRSREIKDIEDYFCSFLKIHLY